MVILLSFYREKSESQLMWYRYHVSYFVPHILLSDLLPLWQYKVQLFSIGASCNCGTIKGGNMAYVPLVTCIVSFIFAVTVLDQYFARRKPYQLLWAIGLFMYCVSTFTEFWWNVYGHVDIMYRLWYLIGAILVAAYLGQGTLYLLMRRRNANIIMAVLGAATVYAAVRIFTVNIDISGLTKLTGVGIMPTDVRAIITPIFNTFGTLALVGGAVYSAFIFWRKRILPHRVVC